MNTNTIKTIVFFLLAVCTGVTCGCTDAFADFSVNWGLSDDDGRVGSRHLADWLVAHDYFDDPDDARTYAETGYIGYHENDPYPSSWTVSGLFRVEAMPGYGDAISPEIRSFGYYTGSGSEKMLIPTLGTAAGSRTTFSVTDSFGLYINATDELWYTDRGENEQHGFLSLYGPQPQAVVYELSPSREWLVAWESGDTTMFATDRDYNDMYVKLMTVVPEPVSCVLFLLGGGVLAGAGRYFRRAER